MIFKTLKFNILPFLLIFSAIGFNKSLDAVSLVVESSFEALESIESQDDLSFQSFKTQDDSLESSLSFSKDSFTVEDSFFLPNNELDVLDLDFSFLDSLKSFSSIHNSVFKIVSSDFHLKKFEFSNSSSSSFLVSFYILDLLLPKKQRKIFPSFVSTNSALYQNLNTFPGSVSGVRLSFSPNNINRKLMRYYAIRSDGPPYHSLNQVCTV
ncbi:hypothetical protein DLM78_15100 [Leptospira stimsonii]|uniref:Uncharacterized protein n=1 Tax=Leptospira stimsonii TaxID=2202203 RepID=A0A8B6RYA1_9LEPT|nr:hypothetical protein DLM78_15100 [Leptospira stimsonii]